MIVARKALLALFFAYCSPVSAQDRVAIIVSSESFVAPAGSEQADVLALSETLFGMGFAVSRLQDPDEAALKAAIAATPANATALFYFRGAAVAEDNEIVLLSGGNGIPLDPVLAALHGAGRPQTLVFLDTCSADAVPLPAPDDLLDLFIAMPTAPGAECLVDAPDMVTLMQERLIAPGQALTEQFPATAVVADTAPRPGLWVRSTLARPFVFRAATSGTQLTAADYDMLERLSPEDRERMIALWTDAGIAVDIGKPPTGGLTARVIETAVVTSPVQPVVIQSASVLSPITATISPILTGAEVEGDALIVLAATPITAAPARPRAVPGAGGLPQPSVVLGETATLASLATPAPAQQLDYTDIAARQAAKTADPAAYEQLILTGAYDPPPEQLAAAVQTELARMNCYTSAIDGDWGNGSRRALQLYFDTLEIAAPSQDPTVDIFRQLLQKDDVACPEVAAPAPAPAAAAPRTTQRQAAPTQAAPRQAAPAPQPAAPAPTEGRRIRQSNGTGAFR
jgi:hypothetical protein